MHEQNKKVMNTDNGTIEILGYLDALLEWEISGSFFSEMIKK